jgi:thiamine biosynthesis lipoprotein
MSELADTIETDSRAVSAGAGRVEISESTYTLLQKNDEYSRLSDGRFNMPVYTLISLYGFPRGPFYIPSDGEIEKAMSDILHKKITVKLEDDRFYADGQGLKFDLGATAKGWIVDVASNYLRTQGVNDFVINAGGDLYASGMKGNSKWRMGIADPDKKRAYVTVVNLSDKALATSGTYERFFIADDGRRISHIFDATTGEPASSYKSVSVIAETAEIADSFSTIYFLVSENEMLSLCKAYNTPVFVITKDNKERRYCGWEDYE